MKKNSFKLSLILLVTFFSACNIAEDLKLLQAEMENMQIVIGTPEFNTLVRVEIADAKNNDLISGKTVSVQVSGKNATDVYSNIGTREASHTTNQGLIMLVIDPKAVDSVAMRTNPIEFDLSVSADGYLPTTQRVTLHHAKLNTVTVRLVNINNAPQGVSVAVNNTFAVTGITGQTTLPANQSLNMGKQRVTIPSGVILRDASGSPVTGSVRAEIVYYDPISTSAQNAFPGGTSVSATLPDGTEGRVEFISAGMFTVNLSAGGSEVKTFDNGGIQLRTVVPPSLINPNTGQPIKAGDRVEMWSRDKGSGEWVYEKTSTVVLENGEFILQETVNHLSDWNWDFFFNSCDIGARFIFDGNITGNLAYAMVSSRLQNTVYDKTTWVDLSTGYLQLIYVPTNSSASFRFEDAGWDPARRLTFSPSTINVQDLCSTTAIRITVTETVPNPPQMITVNFDLEATSASNSQLVIRPNAFIYFRHSGTGRWSDFFLRNGSATVRLELEKDYEIMGSFGNNSGSGHLRIDRVGTNQLRLTISPTINFAGGSQNANETILVDRPSNDIINVRYNAVLPDRIMNQLR